MIASTDSVGDAAVVPHQSNESSEPLVCNDTEKLANTFADNINSFDRANNLQLRLVQVNVATNPLLEAAQPLLRALADIPAKLSMGSVATLRQLLKNEITDFQSLCDKANLSPKHISVVRYCICTALDESINRTEWGKNEWASKSLLVIYEGESDGGEKFFLLIGRMATDPQQFNNVLEVLLRILGLGFEGRYSVIEDGRAHLDSIRQRILSLLMTTRDPLKPALSPNWQGEPVGRLRLLRSIPVWITGLIFGLMLSGLFSWYKYRLLDNSGSIERRIIDIAKLPPQSVHPPPLTLKIQLLRLAVLLKMEIASGLVSVSEDARGSIVTFKGDAMFLPAQSRVQRAVEPTLDKVAGEIARVNAKVTIIGHTDSQSIHTSEFSNNQVLSEKRAAFVGQYLQTRGVHAKQIDTVGRGAAEPIADNVTAAGRACNRRVDIVVTQ
ncbi:type VI secretion system protein TssL, long form [Glaciimonas sp. GG7]